MEKYHLLTDRELVHRCLGGDAGAWEALINCYKRLIYSLPFKFGLSPDEATDVFQSVCMILLEKLHTLRDETMLSRWLITTASRECLKVRRLRGTGHLNIDDVEEELNKMVLGQESSPDQIILTLEKQSLLHRGLHMVDQKCRQLIYYLYFDQETSYEEISQRLQITYQSISPTRSRCLEKLKKILKKLGIK